MDEKKQAGIALEEIFRSVLKNGTKEHDTKKNGEKLLSQEDAEQIISNINADILAKDAESKITFRKITLRALFILLGFQILFMNVTILWLFISQTVNCNFFVEISENKVSSFSEVTKWYTTTVIAELVAAFFYVIRAVFDTPAILNFSSNKKSKKK